MRPPRALLGCAATAVLAACTTAVPGTASSADGGPSTPGAGVVLPHGSGCGYAFFYATDDGARTAVTVYVDVTDRQTDTTTTVDFTLPHPDVSVRILRGDRLDQNFCTDVIDAQYEPTSEQEAVAGTGHIEVGPTGPGSGCGEVEGTLTLEGLEAEDGTTFAPISVSTDLLGCALGG